MLTPNKIRRAAADDLPELKLLYTGTIMTVCANDYTREQQDVWAASSGNEKRWAKAVADQFFIVAEKEGSIAGFASLDNDDYVDFLYVHKDSSGRASPTGCMLRWKRKHSNWK